MVQTMQSFCYENKHQGSFDSIESCSPNLQSSLKQWNLFSPSKTKSIFYSVLIYFVIHGSPVSLGSCFLHKNFNNKQLFLYCFHFNHVDITLRVSISAISINIRAFCVSFHLKFKSPCHSCVLFVLCLKLLRTSERSERVRLFWHLSAKL